MTVLGDLLAAVGATEPAPEPAQHEGWPLLGIAAAIALILFAIAYRHRPGDDE